MPNETPAEHEAVTAAREALGAMAEAIDKGQMIFCDASGAEPGADCWDWLHNFITTIYALVRHNRLTGLRILFTFDTRERR